MKNKYLFLTLFMSVVAISYAQVFPTTNWSDNTDVSWYDDNNTSFTISTAEAFAGLSQLVEQGNDFVGKTITVGADINLNEHLWTPIGTGVDFPFSGTIDGGNFTISNLWINLPNDDFVGLVGQSLGGTFSNIVLQGVNILALDTAGSVVANLSVNSTMENCHASNASVTGTGFNIGGLVGGSLTQSHIAGCSFIGDVIGDSQVGGVVGTAWDNANVIECYSEGTVSGGFLIGGLIGYCTFAFDPGTQNIVDNSYSRATITATFGRAGGLYGGSDGSLVLLNSYATGNVTAPEFVGGIIGAWGFGEISVTNTFFDVDTSQLTDGVGGFLGPTASFDITGRTTPEMKNTEIVTLLNAGSVGTPWSIDPNTNDGYPILTRFLSVYDLDFNTSSVKVYPTIFDTDIHINSNVTLTSYDMYSISGALALKGSLINKTTIDTASLQAGVYLLNLNSANGSFITKKVVKK